MKKKPWSFSAGEYRNTVTVYERKPGGPIYVRVRSPKDHTSYVRRSLGHSDQERAKSYALEQSAKLLQGQADILAGRITLAEVFALYEKHRLPKRKPQGQAEDKRRIAMWLRILGPSKDPYSVSLGDWEWFERTRMSGEIDAHGRIVPEDDRKKIRSVTVKHDLAFLRWVFLWAVSWRTRTGKCLMREDPTRGWHLPEIKNQRRPVATRDRYEALRSKASEVRCRATWNGRAVERPSYLLELLDIVVGTGRRITAVLSLRYEDLQLECSPSQPYGAIHWPSETDKEGREMIVPVTPEVRDALDRALRDRPGIGQAFLFPSMTDRCRPLGRHTATAWLKKCETLAGLDPLNNGAWHPFRRMWATERKHLADVDVARAGGWKSIEVMKQSYQHADPATTLQVVMGAGELREIRSKSG